MGKIAILTEKPSAAKNFAAALGGMSGSFEGQEYIIVHARGHLLELKDPADQVPESLREKYASWEVGNLPWDVTDFSWEIEPRRKAVKSGGKVVRKPDPDAVSLLNDLKSKMAGCEGAAAAGDLDPTGEGAAIGWNIVNYLGLENKKLYRMEFLDESPKSIQEAFRKLRPVTSPADEGEFRKAEFRNRWDMLSMQFTRAASKIAGSQAPLRNGRLKSAMVVLVGDQLAAHNDYVKKPFFENRFRDENGVVYTDPEVDRFENQADVPGGLAASAVVNDGVKRKKTAPPKLYELSGLSAMMSKKGYSAAKVLSTYQAMYDSPHNYLSYPRTEDRFVSEEQFKEMLPLVDKIARVVGVDPALLSHRTPRKGSHVKNGGAHGANRPGLNVPSSLEEIESKFGKLGREIYETLAKNYLRMLAPDYEYDQHSGHVADYPTYKGTLNVPAVLGWKGVFVSEDDSDDEEDETGSAKGLGTTAEPFIHEGYPPRPPHPSMTWLMKQLERRAVGTGATRTSTYAEVTNNTGGRALLLEKRGGKLELSDLGSLNHRILPGTHIGSLDLTAKVFDQMKQIEKAGAPADAFLAEVAGLVREDIATMQRNVADFPADFKAKMAKAGVYKEPVEVIELPPALHHKVGDRVVTRAKRVFSGHRFTDEEVAKLVAGETIEVTATSARTGNQYTCQGKLEPGEYKGHPFVAFKPQFTPRTDQVEGTWKGKKVKFKAKGWGANDHWEGKDFSETEIKMLLNGETIQFDAVSRQGKTYKAKGALGESTYKGSKTFGFQLQFDDKPGGGARGGGRRK